MKDWTKEQLERFSLEKLSDQIDHEEGNAPIDRYKRYIDDYGYLMGYYFKGIS